MPAIKPTVNINGTSADELRDQYLGVYKALNDTLTAMRMSRPHGRDYQGAQEGVFELALDEHSRRAMVIEDLKDCIMLDYAHISEVK